MANTEKIMVMSCPILRPPCHQSWDMLGWLKQSIGPEAMSRNRNRNSWNSVIAIWQSFVPPMSGQCCNMLCLIELCQSNCMSSLSHPCLAWLCPQAALSPGRDHKQSSLVHPWHQSWSSSDVLLFLIYCFLRESAVRFEMVRVSRDHEKVHWQFSVVTACCCMACRIDKRRWNRFLHIVTKWQWGFVHKNEIQGLHRESNV